MAIGLFGPESIRKWRSFEFSGRYDIPKDRNSPRLGSQKDRPRDGLGVGLPLLVDAVGVARNVVAAASSRVAECVFLPTKYVVDFGRELAPL